MAVSDILYTLFISPLKLLFEIIFSYANKLTNHPGLSIIVLSLSINLLVLPLYKRSDAMQEEERLMQARLQKGVSHIKRVFKGDERMLILQTYYRQNHYKPTYVLRGATSLFLEIPFFMAAYSFLSNLAMLSGVAFGPIQDLGKPDALLSVFGMHFNLLPVVMTVVNCISTAIFTKDYPLKTKVQLYGMAAFFLVFLYDSPAGLVFYWTLNNVFSLIKTLSYRMKNPKKVFSIVAQITGWMLIVIGLFWFEGKKQAFLLVLGLALQYPMAVKLLHRKGFGLHAGRQIMWASNSKGFFMAGLFMSLLTGLVIPSSVIKASPLEFVSHVSFYNPLWYVVSSACMSFGFFMIWFGVFYWLASDKGKAIFEWIMYVLCAAAIADYLFFGRNLGILNATLQYENGMSFRYAEILANLLVVAAVTIAVSFATIKQRRMAPELLLVASLAMVGLSFVNVASIHQTVDDYLVSSAGEADEIKIPLSKKGKNIVVLMLDRAAGHMVPYIMNEKPELKEQFAGFTYYSNVVSFGRNTNFASAALYGGYEYTPLEINRRDTMLLREKQNEALKVMPVLFLNEGYDVTVFDPTYANYQWIPDLSIYDDYPEIKRAITMGSFNGRMSERQNDKVSRMRKSRNMFCYGVMKSVPLLMQSTLYENGSYRHLEETSENTAWEDFESYPEDNFQTEVTPYQAHGIYSAFLDAYSVLTHLCDITEIEQGDTGTFLMMSNDTTHNGTMLQEPDYVPAWEVDNTEYEMEHADRFTLDGKTLHLEDSLSIQHYQINVAALLQLGKWFDYLREEGVYDNTRIILVSDHNAGIENMEELMIPIEGQGELNITGFYPLLMVKDFGSAGEFSESTAFMTNADVPSLAAAGVIDDPVNPFTGASMHRDAKENGKVYLFAGWQWDTAENNGCTFLPANWYSVHDDIWNPDNWQAEGYGILPN